MRDAHTLLMAARRDLAASREESERRQAAQRDTSAQLSVWTEKLASRQDQVGPALCKVPVCRFY